MKKKNEIKIKWNDLLKTTYGVGTSHRKKHFMIGFKSQQVIIEMQTVKIQPIFTRERWTDYACALMYQVKR